MEAVKNPAVMAVTEVVVKVPAQPETFDLKGLSREQMAFLAILTGCVGGGPKGVVKLYETIIGAIGVDNDTILDVSHGGNGISQGWNANAMRDSYIEYVVKNSR